LPTKSLDDLSDALQKIIQLNSWALTLGNDMVIYPELTENIKCEDDKRIRKFDVKALSALKSENIDELLKINSEFLSYLKDNRYNPDQIKKSCTSYAFSILVYYKEFNVELYEKVQVERLLDRLNDSCTIKELNDCLDNLVIMYIAESQINQKVNSALVRKIINHISNYYFDKISLEDIAVKMNVSPEYLSHLFTKEVGASFSEYLKKFRINEAKKLMPNSNYKIYEIGEKIGYKDPKYFCKVFKEVTGFSPKEYMTKQ
jgi:two-component system response regulator YesN